MSNPSCCLVEYHFPARSGMHVYIASMMVILKAFPFTAKIESMLARPSEDLIIVSTYVHRPCSIRTRRIFEHRRLRLPLQRCVSATHDCIAEVTEAMVIMINFTFAECEVSLPDFQDEFVHEAGDGHQAVEFMEQGNGIDFLSWRFRVMHGWR